MKDVDSLQSVLDRIIDNRRIFGTSFSIKKDDRIWSGASGDIEVDQPFFIASTTKLFTTAIILRLRSEGKLMLDQPIGSLIDSHILDGLHHYKGSDYSRKITVTQLLAHTSGLPDYFQNKGPGGTSLEDEIVGGKDQSWTFEDAMERTKQIKPLFAPGTPGKAHYSDANFQLLGKIVENGVGTSYAQACRDFITQELGLSKTYVYQDASDATPKGLYYKSSPLEIPKAMTSFQADGGVVSTSKELLVFVEAFFGGRLFPKAYLEELQIWNRIFFPMQSGIGIHLFRLPWIFNPMRSVPDFIGHSGLSGALAFFSPKTNFFVAGTVNQVAHPDLSFRTMIKLAQVAGK